MPRSTRAQIYWVPRPGDWLADDILAWAEEGLTDVVSFLEEHEARELGLRTEGACVIQAGLQLESFPVPDHGVPRRIDAAVALWSRLARKIEAAGSGALHCRASIGRSNHMAAGVLCSLGEQEPAVWQRLSEARGLSVPDTEEQRRWISQVLRTHVRVSKAGQ